MNTNDESLRWQLRGLRKDVMPEQDLWPAIASRISATSQLASTPHRTRWQPWAVAACLMLVAGLALRMQDVQEPSSALLQQQAALLTQDYETALSQFHHQQARPEQAYLEQANPELAGALQELDASAAQIRAAIGHNPSARFLLEQLRRTYTQRLSLTQRAALS